MEERWLEVLDLYRDADPIIEHENLTLLRHELLPRKDILNLDVKRCTSGNSHSTT